jgi:hypothetical protein
MARVASLLEKGSNIKVTILKILQHSRVAIFTVWNGELDANNRAMLNFPKATMFTKGIDYTVKIVH